LAFLFGLTLGLLLGLALGLLLGLALGLLLGLALGFLFHLALGLLLGLALGFLFHLTLGLLLGFALSDFTLSRPLPRYFPLLRGLPLRGFFTRPLFGSHNFLRAGDRALSIYNKNKKSSQLSEPVNIFGQRRKCQFRP